MLSLFHITVQVCMAHIRKQDSIFNKSKLIFLCIKQMFMLFLQIFQTKDNYKILLLKFQIDISPECKRTSCLSKGLTH